MDRPHRDADARRLLDAGDLDGAVTMAIERYGPAVLKYLRLSLRDEQDAGDAYSAFEEHVWRGLAAFRTESSLRTWMFRVARNAASDVRKQRWRRVGRQLTAGTPEDIAEEELETPAQLHEMREVFHRLRQFLSESERTLLSLRVEQERSWAEIARALSRGGRALDTTTVIKRFGRLATRLRRMARQHGLVP